MPNQTHAATAGMRAVYPHIVALLDLEHSRGRCWYEGGEVSVKQKNLCQSDSWDTPVIRGNVDHAEGTISDISVFEALIESRIWMVMNKVSRNEYG